MGREAGGCLYSRAARLFAAFVRGSVDLATTSATLAVPVDIKRSAYFGRYEHHYVFFRELKNGDLGVMSILHERMNLPVRLKEDLAALLNKQP